MKRVKLILLLLLCLLTAACGKSTSKPVELAVLDVQEAAKGHKLHGEYVKTKEEILRLQEAKQAQLRMVDKQLAGLDKMLQNTQEHRQKFNSAVLGAKFSELEAAAQMEVLKLRNQTLLELRKEFAAQEEEIRDKYKSRIFNAKAKLQLLRLKEAERVAAVADLQAAEQEQAEALGKLQEQQMLLAQERTKVQEQEILRKLDNQALALQREMIASGQAQEADFYSKADKLAREMKAAVDTVQQEIDNQEKKAGWLEERMSKDATEVAIKIAKDKGYGLVFGKVRVNIKGVDLTEQVKSALSRQG